jgi:phosphoserine phosphatase RsbU/P
MSSAALRQLLRRHKESRELVALFAEALGGAVALEGVQSGVLPATVGITAEALVPLAADGAGAAWMADSPQATAMTALLDHLVARDVERKALGAEVLNLYREVNLIYSFSEKLAALLDVERVAALTLQETRHVIVATDGVVMLLDDTTNALSTVAGFGDVLPGLRGIQSGEGILGTVALKGIGEIVNDVQADLRRIRRDMDLRSLIASPLTVGERVIGIIALASTQPMVYSAGELKLLSTLALQAATAIENARLFERTVQAAVERERLLALHQHAELARARLENELELASRIQAELFPAEMPRLAGYDLAARNRPARQCGGDYYDAVILPPGDHGARVLLCVADVSGKGLPAALLMSSMQATLRALLGRTSSLSALAALASELLFASTSGNKYVTAALFELTPATGAARYVSAGHVDSLLLRRGGEALALGSTGTPLGLIPGGMPYGEGSAVLAPGDSLVLYSDGVPEAQNAEGEEFGEDRLAEIVRRSVGESSATIVGRVFEAIDMFAGAAPQFDDITLLVLQRAPPNLVP